MGCCQSFIVTVNQAKLAKFGRFMRVGNISYRIGWLMYSKITEVGFSKSKHLFLLSVQSTVKMEEVPPELV